MHSEKYESDIEARPSKDTPRARRKSRIKIRIAFVMSIVAITIFALMSNTVDGNSALSDAAIAGETSAVGLTALAYALGVVLGLGSLLVALEPAISGHNRVAAIVVALIGVSAPITGGAIASLVSLFTS